MKFSKSKLLTYIQCPLLFKYSVIDKLPPDIPNPAYKKGKELHMMFEQYANNIPVDVPNKYMVYWRNFLRFIEWMGTKPFIVERKIYDPKFDINGVVDAVYIKGDQTIVVDYKTSAYDPTKIPMHRIELSFYTHLLKVHDINSTHVAIAFLKSGDVFIEPSGNTFEVYTLPILNTVRNKVVKGNFEPIPSDSCKRCEYRTRCPKWSGGIK